MSYYTTRRNPKPGQPVWHPRARALDTPPNRAQWPVIVQVLQRGPRYGNCWLVTVTAPRWKRPKRAWVYWKPGTWCVSDWADGPLWESLSERHEREASARA